MGRQAAASRQPTPPVPQQALGHTMTSCCLVTPLPGRCDQAPVCTAGASAAPLAGAPPHLLGPHDQRDHGLRLHCLGRLVNQQAAEAEVGQPRVARARARRAHHIGGLQRGTRGRREVRCRSEGGRTASFDPSFLIPHCRPAHLFRPPAKSRAPGCVSTPCTCARLQSKLGRGAVQ
jgi:hypothetical protein